MVPLNKLPPFYNACLTYVQAYDEEEPAEVEVKKLVVGHQCSGDNLRSTHRGVNTYPRRHGEGGDQLITFGGEM
jgi:hypothetical protein